MLTRTQAEKLEIASKLLEEVIESEIDTEIPLEDAQNIIDELLAEYYPDGYVPPKKTPIRIKFVPRPRYEKLQDRFFLIASDIGGTALLVSFVSACISFTCWGLSDLKGGMGYKSQPDFAASQKAYQGLAVASLGITLTASTIAAVLGEKKDV